MQIVCAGSWPAFQFSTLGHFWRFQKTGDRTISGKRSMSGRLICNCTACWNKAMLTYRKQICLVICKDCDAWHTFFKVGKVVTQKEQIWCPAWNGKKKLNKGQETMGMSWKMQQRHLEDCSMPADLFGSLLLLFIQLPNIIRKRGLDVKDLCQKYVHSSEIGCNNNRCV